MSTQDVEKVLQPWFNTDERKVLKLAVDVGVQEAVSQGASALDDLTDVDATAPDLDDLLFFDGTDTWEARQLAAGEVSYAPSNNNETDITFGPTSPTASFTVAGNLVLLHGTVAFTSELVAPGSMDIRIGVPVEYNGYTYAGGGVGVITNVTTGGIEAVNVIVLDSQNSIICSGTDTTGSGDSYTFVFSAFMVVTGTP